MLVQGAAQIDVKMHVKDVSPNGELASDSGHTCRKARRCPLDGLICSSHETSMPLLFGLHLRNTHFSSYLSVHELN